jgi:hypothetical protein
VLETWIFSLKEESVVFLYTFTLSISSHSSRELALKLLGSISSHQSHYGGTKGLRTPRKSYQTLARMRYFLIAS